MRPTELQRKLLGEVSAEQIALDQAMLLQSACGIPLIFTKRVMGWSTKSPGEVISTLKRMVEDVCLAEGCPPRHAGFIVAEQTSQIMGWSKPQKLKRLPGFEYDGSPEAQRLFDRWLRQAQLVSRIRQTVVR